MPELPEVETIRRDLAKSILQKTFCHVQVPDPFVLRTPPHEFTQALIKRSVKAVLRRGKALIVILSEAKDLKGHKDSSSLKNVPQNDRNLFLVIQLMMTGQLVIGAKPDRHTRVVFEFTDGTNILYNDQRRFGQLRIIKDLREVNYFNVLGPEPLEKDFNAEYVFERTRLSRKPIKNLLLDHTFVAGIGNIYACEILFRCRINPKRLAHRINRIQAKEIYQKTGEVLREAIKYRGASMRNYRDASGEKGRFRRRIKVYAREDEFCLVCSKIIQRITQSGRSTFFCPQCQK